MNTCCPNCGTEFDPAMADGADPEQPNSAAGSTPPVSGSMLEAITREIAAVPRGQRKE